MVFIKCSIDSKREILRLRRGRWYVDVKIFFNTIAIGLCENIKTILERTLHIFLLRL